MQLNDDKPIFKKDPTDTEFTAGKAVFISIISFFNVFMLLGNSLSILTITTNRHLRKEVSYWFVLNLAVTDLFIAVTVVPLNTAWEYFGSWPFSSSVCVMFTFADISFSTISAYSIVLVSIDKYVYITYPLQYFDRMTKKVAIILIAAVWLMMFVFATISVTTDIGTEENFRDHFYVITNGTATCLFVMTDAYVIPSAIISFFIPLFVLFFTSTKIICIASHHIKRIHEVSLCVPSDTNSGTKKSSIKYEPNIDSTSFGTGLCSKKKESSKCRIQEERQTDTDSQKERPNLSVDSQISEYECKGQTTVAFDEEKAASISIISDGVTREQKVTLITGNKIKFNRDNKNSGNIGLVSEARTSFNDKKFQRHVLKQAGSLQKVSRKSSSYCKLFGTVTIVIAFFVIMFSPYYIAIMIDVSCHCVEPWVYEDILSVFYFMHSLVNPYIYMFTDRKYKTALKRLYRRIKK